MTLRRTARRSLVAGLTAAAVLGATVTAAQAQLNYPPTPQEQAEAFERMLTPQDAPAILNISEGVE